MINKIRNKGVLQRDIAFRLKYHTNPPTTNSHASVVGALTQLSVSVMLTSNA